MYVPIGFLDLVCVGRGIEAIFNFSTLALKIDLKSFWLEE